MAYPQRFLERRHLPRRGKKSTARDTGDVNRLNGPSKALTATDGQQIKLTANYFSRFNHVIGKLPGHGHGRPSNEYGHGRSVLAAASLLA